ncbi:60S ribosomal protein L39, partial [Rhizoclosmatium hyalinum]
PSNKSFLIKRKLGKAQKQNRPIPNWFRFKTDTTIRYIIGRCTYLVSEEEEKEEWMRTQTSVSH